MLLCRRNVYVYRHSIQGPEICRKENIWRDKKMRALKECWLMYVFPTVWPKGNPWSPWWSCLIWIRNWKGFIGNPHTRPKEGIFSSLCLILHYKSKQKHFVLHLLKFQFEIFNKTRLRSSSPLARCGNPYWQPTDTWIKAMIKICRCNLYKSQ